MTTDAIKGEVQEIDGIARGEAGAQARRFEVLKQDATPRGAS